MGAATPKVDVVLAALADPTRRGVFEDVLARGPVTATALAAGRDISRQAVTKHLERLAEAGLAGAERSGRETLWSADPAPLGVAMDWMTMVGAAWDRRLQRLAGRFGSGRSDPDI